MSKKQSKSTDLGVLQTEAENAAKRLKGARTVHANAVQALVRAEEAHNVAQKALAAGVAQVSATTKVL